MQSAETESVRTCTPLLSQAGRVVFGNGAQQPWESCRGLRRAQPGRRCLVCLRRERTGEQGSIWTSPFPAQKEVLELVLSLGRRNREPRPGCSKCVTPDSGLFAVLPLLMILPQHLLGLVLLLIILAAPCWAGRALRAEGCSSTSDGNQSSACSMWNSMGNTLLLSFVFPLSLFQVQADIYSKGDRI